MDNLTELRKELIREVISMYHTTRMAETPAENHILSKPSVLLKFQKYDSELERRVVRLGPE